MPLGASLAQRRPGAAQIRIHYGGGRYYNIESRRFSRLRLARSQPRMHHSSGALVLDLPGPRSSRTAAAQPMARRPAPVTETP